MLALDTMPKGILKQVSINAVNSQPSCTAAKPGWTTADYMSKQPDINGEMRKMLLDWLLQVIVQLKYCIRTFHLAVGLIDSFLSKTKIARKGMQLVGVTALNLAVKYQEEVASPITDYVFICDKAYTAEEVLGMEKLILPDLSGPFDKHGASDFEAVRKAVRDLELPTSQLASMYIKKTSDSASCDYFVALALIEYDIAVKYSPQQIANAAINMTNLNKNGAAKYVLSDTSPSTLEETMRAAGRKLDYEKFKGLKMALKRAGYSA